MAAVSTCDWVIYWAVNGRLSKDRRVKLCTGSHEEPGDTKKSLFLMKNLAIYSDNMIKKKFKAWQAHIKYTSYQLLTSQLMGHPFARFQSHLSILYGYLTPKPYMGNTPPHLMEIRLARRGGLQASTPLWFRTNTKRKDWENRQGGGGDKGCVYMRGIKKIMERRRGGGYLGELAYLILYLFRG